MIRYGVAIFALALTLAACGGGGGGSVGPPNPGGGNPGGGNPSSSPSSNPTSNPSGSPAPTHSPGGTPTPRSTAPPTPTPTPHQTPPPTPTPTPQSTPYPAWPGIILDTKSQTEGVYIGEICNASIRPLACAEDYDQYPNGYAHSLAFENVFANWQTNLQKFMSGNEFTLWAEPNKSGNIVPMITWEPQNILYTDINAGKYDTLMENAATYLAQFGYPVFLRPFHEFNGGWNSWGLVNQGGNSQTDQEFIAAWQRMVSIMRPIAPNIKFVWCYANQSVPNQPWNDPVNVYPGDSYVDWIAFDAFNRGTYQGGWKWFAPLIQDAYNKALKISPNKPVMLAETGSNEWGDNDNGSHKAQWFTQMFSDIQSQFQNMRAIDYYDSSETQGPHPYTFALTSSTAAYDAWAEFGIRPVGPDGVLLYRGNGEPMFQITTAH